LIGIFLTKKIEKGLGIAETSKRIRAQGGLVVAAHPLDIFRREAMGKKVFERNLGSFDIVEIFNSRNLINNGAGYISKLIKTQKIPVIVGADAHIKSELGNTWIEMGKFTGPESFLKELETAKFHRKRAGFWPHLITIYIKRFLKR
jgi:predicted metal-dependent phosphoesterase TrpH